MWIPLLGLQLIHCASARFSGFAGYTAPFLRTYYLGFYPGGDPTCGVAQLLSYRLPLSTAVNHRQVATGNGCAGPSAAYNHPVMSQGRRPLGLLACTLLILVLTLY